VLAAVRLRISNGRMEGLNNKIGVIKHRAYGFHSFAALAAIAFLCCTDLQPVLLIAPSSGGPGHDRALVTHGARAPRRPYPSGEPRGCGEAVAGVVRPRGGGRAWRGLEAG
jgi:hypothetical protein